MSGDFKKHLKYHSMHSGDTAVPSRGLLWSLC